jgi:alpha-glucosidase (family GH31 glycosyl hydrolase)
MYGSHAASLRFVLKRHIPKLMLRGTYKKLLQRSSCSLDQLWHFARSEGRQELILVGHLQFFRILDLHIFVGPSPADVMQQYTDLIGRPYLPPYWSLGFHLCRFNYSSLNHTETILENNIQAGIPIVRTQHYFYHGHYSDNYKAKFTLKSTILNIGQGWVSKLEFGIRNAISG